MGCTPQELVEAAKCYRCLDPKTLDAAEVYVLAAWANEGITPEEQIVLGDPVADFMFGDPTSGVVFGD